MPVASINPVRIHFTESKLVLNSLINVGRATFTALILNVPKNTPKNNEIITDQKYSSCFSFVFINI
ncbi:hypothetical protein rsdtw13_14990 [Clostridium sp. TW13]|uniref:Uncharacterized protein n=1 Tax=Inconstantimicrobium mannanitabidum TaxID=1604901 RepID=A0ACB5RC10_9CLOT|nr:hypothetical protein rsdtw13_14990 [Clostridium sp. TW13]